MLFYSASTKGAGETLHTIIKTFVPRREIEIYRTIDGLRQRLRQSLCDHAIAILLAQGKKELEEFVRMGDLLDGLCVVLVVPDREEDTVAKAHALRPRFLTYVDSSFVGVAAVLSKMLVPALQSDGRNSAIAEPPCAAFRWDEYGTKK